MGAMSTERTPVPGCRVQKLAVTRYLPVAAPASSSDTFRRGSPATAPPPLRRWRGTAPTRCRTYWCAGCFDVRSVVRCTTCPPDAIADEDRRAAIRPTPRTPPRPGSELHDGPVLDGRSRPGGTVPVGAGDPRPALPPFPQVDRAAGRLEDEPTEHQVVGSHAGVGGGIQGQLGDSAVRRQPRTRRTARWSPGGARSQTARPSRRGRVTPPEEVRRAHPIAATGQCDRLGQHHNRLSTPRAEFGRGGMNA